MNWLVRRRRLVCRFVVTVCLVLLSTSIASGSFISVAHSGSSGPYQAEDYVVHYVAPNASLLAEDARSAIGQSLRSWAGTTTSARSFYLINLRWEESWALGTLTFADLSQPLREGGGSHLNFDNLLGLLLVSDLDGWRAAIEVDPQISDLLTLVPEEEFDSRSRRALFPSAEQLRMPDALAPNQAYDGYKFPWRAGPAWRVTQGWHDPSTWGGRFPSTTSLDFDIVGQSNADIVAPASGTVT